MDYQLDLSEEVFCDVISTSSLSDYCQSCYRGTDDGWKRCIACKAVYYCSTECQKSDWKLHKEECQLFQGLDDPRKINERIRLVLRLGHHWALGELGKVASAWGDRSLSSLEEHPTDAQLELQALLFLDHFKTVIKRKVIGDHIIKKLFKKMVINCFPLEDEFGQSMGLALCIKLSGVRHSCKPVTRLVYSSRRATLLPIAQHESVSPSSATLSYIDELLPVKTRREILLEKYKLKCDCEGCLDTQRNNQMESWVCENCPEGWLPPVDASECTRCGEKAEESHVETSKMVSETVAAGTKVLERKDLSQGSKKELVLKLMDMMNGILTDFNVLRLPCLRFLLQESADSQNLIEAGKYGEMILTVYETYRQSGDISLAHFRYRLATTYNDLGNTKRVGELIDEATLLCFEKAYGRASEVYKKCQRLMSDLSH